MRTELDYIQPTEDCQHPELWSARDGEASEYEVGDLLYGLIRIIKPGVVVETGCYLGDTTARMGEALRDNKHGRLHSCDLDIERVHFVQDRCRELPVQVLHMGGREMIRSLGQIDFAFIDGGDRQEQVEDMIKGPNCVIALHDSRWKVLEPIKSMGFREMFFHTPRGISLLWR